ncbi:MAG: hypothetical protein GDA40_10715, partial [Rhodobacteraceae bacterium]|nr:hypothetical protein [Paracoccaceae bacterium]
RVLEFVSNNPGKTQLEIAKGIYGPDAVQQQVNQDVNLCLQLGLFRREGMGGQNDPYRYYPKDKERGSKNAYPGTLPIYKIVKERVLEFVSNNPGKTQLEIAKGIYGPDAAQQQVNQDVNLCLQLGLFGLFRREGMGGQNDPYRYYLKD